jgi:hypothetical protein
VGHGFSTRGGWFIDPQGRHTLLRGVNLGGSTKVPYTPDGATHLGVDFDNWREVSFVGRPAPLDELDRHLDRIVNWGFNVLRFLVTWEAVEHAGPGVYDEPYLDYVREAVRRAGERGLLVFIDPHHDVWSRWTGGDGAPFWCFDFAGLVPDRFVDAQAVRLDDFDWPANYNRVPVATMWTLFFGGETFFPERPGVQAELQDHYLGAVAAVAERVRDLDHVLGYDSLNEPSVGYIGRAADLADGRRMFDRGEGGPKPFSPLEHLAAADGHTVRHDDGGVLNPDGHSIWRDGCPWQRAGVWDLDAEGRPVAGSSPDFFTHVDGRPVTAWRDFMVPFVQRFRDRMRAVHPDCIVFVEASPMEGDLGWPDDDADPLLCNARHWYDIATLATRRFDPEAYRPLFRDETISGVDAIGELFGGYLEGMARHSRSRMHDMPLLLGEFGIPYEMNGGEAYRSGDYTAQEIALEANYRALDQALVHSTQWNYTADNTHAHGDAWNHEDLSVFSVDDQHDPDDIDSGGRAIDGFVRPHVLHAAGRPTVMRFVDGEFALTVDADPAVAAATEVFVPRRHFPDGVSVTVTTGTTMHDPTRQRLTWEHAGTSGPQTMTVRRP